MAYIVSDNFNLQSKAPNFVRDQFATVVAMKAFPETALDDGHISYCVGDGKTYQYKSGNSVDATLGRWREFASGGGGSVTVKSPLEKDADGSIGIKLSRGLTYDDIEGIRVMGGTCINVDPIHGVGLALGTKGLAIDMGSNLTVNLGSSAPLEFDPYGAIDLRLGSISGLSTGTDASLQLKFDTSLAGMGGCSGLIISTTNNGLRIDTEQLGTIFRKNASVFREALGITSNGSISFQ